MDMPEKSESEPHPPIFSHKAPPLPLAYQALNAQAAKWLSKAGQKLEDLQPVFQLMLWGLEQGINNGDPEYTGQLKVGVEQLAYQDETRKALQYLTEHPDNPTDPPMISSDQLSRARSPVHAALLLLQALDMKMSGDDYLRGVYPPV